MGQSYNRRMPADFFTVSNSKKWSARGFAMFAPLWADANFQEGQVTYHIYDRTNTDLSAMEKYRVKHALQLAKEDTVSYGGSSAIDPSWVMVITWFDSTPRMYYNANNEQASLDIYYSFTSEKLEYVALHQIIKGAKSQAFYFISCNNVASII